MRLPSARVILWSNRVTSHKTKVEPTSIAISSTSKSCGIMAPKMATGSPNTMQILKILLPIMLPTSRSCSPRRAAIMVVTSSGSEVPIAMIEREMMRSEIPMVAATAEAELTTSSLPMIVPARPTMTSRMDFLSLYLGLSDLILRSRLLRAMRIR